MAIKKKIIAPDCLKKEYIANSKYVGKYFIYLNRDTLNIFDTKTQTLMYVSKIAKVNSVFEEIATNIQQLEEGKIMAISPTEIYQKLTKVKEIKDFLILHTRQKIGQENLKLFYTDDLNLPVSNAKYYVILIYDDKSTQFFHIIKTLGDLIRLSTYFPFLYPHYFPSEYTIESGNIINKNMNEENWKNYDSYPFYNLLKEIKNQAEKLGWKFAAYSINNSASLIIKPTEDFNVSMQKLSDVKINEEGLFQHWKSELHQLHSKVIEGLTKNQNNITNIQSVALDLKYKQLKTTIEKLINEVTV